MGGTRYISGGTVGGGGTGGFTDSFSLKIGLTDSNSTPNDSYSMALNLSQSDSNAGQNEAVTLKFPQPDFADNSATPTETKSFKARIWMSGSAGAGTTSPTNADGQNNGTIATLQTAAAGTNPLILTSALGSNIPTLTVISAIYRGWFKSVNSLSTSTGSITIRSTSALFSDIIIFTNSALNTTVDKLDGSFTYDLFVNGINTLAKLQSVQMLHKTNDAVAGVTPHVLTIDAGCLEIDITL